MWSKYLAIGLSLVLVFLLLGGCEAQPEGEWNDVNYQFPTLEIQPVEIPTGEDEEFEAFDQIRMAGFHNYGEPGEPVLPYRTARILIPQNHEVVSVEVTGEKIKLQGQYLIEPGQVSIPLISNNFSNNFTYTPPNPEIYQSENPFPASPYQVISVQNFRGYKILLVSLIPIEYIPVDRELSYFESMKVSVETAPIEEPNPLYRGTAMDEERVKAMVDNPELLEAYPLLEELALEDLAIEILQLPTDNYDMVIITNDALKPSWNEYASWKTNSRGIKTTVYTVDDIYDEYSGVDNQDKIRNFIIDAYTTWGIEYVLLGGDVDIVPCREALDQCSSYSHDPPFDLYYGGLDGDWDNDGDYFYGEMGPPDEADLLAEVYVGRVPVDNSDHINNFHNKVKDYEEEILTGYRCKALFLGQGSYFGSKKDDTEAKEFPSSWFTITKLYEPPCVDEVKDAINAGTHIINHFGHGEIFAWPQFLSTSHVDSLTNTDYCLCYSVACDTNAFDKDDALSEHFLCTEHGAFAYIGNSRLGKTYESHVLELEFYDALFDEHIMQLGIAYQDSKEDISGQAGTSSCVRYVYYSLNLLGDPSTLLRLGWCTIPQVAAGVWHTVGLKADGQVVAVGSNDPYGQCNVNDWEHIVQVAADGHHTVGVKSDGKVVAVGRNTQGQCNVTDWEHIVQVAAGEWHTVGVKSDGKVVAVGSNDEGQCNVTDWEHIVQVAAGWYHTVGVKSDGKVVAVGAGGDYAYLYDHGQCNVTDWEDIVQVDAGCTHTVGLKSDGKVVAVGWNSSGECNVSDWEDIVQVAAGVHNTVGLKSDGRVVAVGWNIMGELDIGDWTEIIQVATCHIHTVGVKADGTVVATGAGDVDWDYGQCDVGGWDLFS